MSDLPGFTQAMIDTGELRLSVHRAGQGAPLILLHGFPQNHRCWEKVAPAFAEHFHVIVPDLRGYGDSDAPPDDAGHRAYSKRRMAEDITGLMAALGIERAHLLGHDRGARVAYRMALDHPERVARLGLIEILPTVEYWDAFGSDLAMALYHWTFLAQPAPVPERMIGADPGAWIEHTLKSWTRAKSLSPFSATALASYRAQAADPARLTAMCADYRAGATIDRAQDAEDRDSGLTIAAPLHFLWAEGGFPARAGDPAATWRRWARSVTDSSCVSGHCTMEENPEAVLAAFLPHFRKRG